MCEEEIKKATDSVFKYILPKSWSKERKEDDPITAERVVEAIKYGKDVEIKNAVIEGPFILKSVNAEGEVAINNTTIRGPIDWSYATFKRVLNLENSIFETDATFTAVKAEKDIFLDEATFCGEAVFTDITVMGAFYSRSTTFKKDVIFSDGIVKKGIAFSKSTFVGDANFGRARIGSAAKFRGAEFKQRASFKGAQIDGDVFFNPYLFNIDVEFEEELNKDSISEKLKKIFKAEGFSICQNAIVTKDKGDNWVITDGGKNHIVKKEDGKLNIYNLSTTFGGEANFGSARIGGTADFTGVKFKKKASFNGAQIESDALFNTACLFSIDVEFKDDLNKGIIPEKLKNLFEKELKNIFKTEEYSLSKKAMVTNGQDDKWRITDIEEIYIVKKEKGKLNIYNLSTTFGGEANFVSARIGGTAEFTGVKFKKKASFNRARIKESAFFDPATFEGEANFIGARIGSIAVFRGTEFKKRAIFNRTQIEGSAFFDPATFEDVANFRSARIGSNARFTEAKFKQQAIFNSAQIEGESHFEGTIFDNDVSFQDSTLKTVFWGEPNVQFIKNIDLRGCIYDRIHPLSFWQQLMEHLGPYDRQPFTQLEETFRRAGKDKLADDVYYMQKRRESTKKFIIQNPGAWLLDRFLWLLTGYGVRLYRLLGAFILILMLGTVIFQLEGAVTPELHSALPCSEAFWVSLNTFLPVIEIPSGADWEPSSQIIPVLGIKFTTLATLLVLAGWILVPVAVAGIAGLLKRSK